MKPKTKLTRFWASTTIDLLSESGEKLGHIKEDGEQMWDVYYVDHRGVDICLTQESGAFETKRKAQLFLIKFLAKNN